MKKRAKKSKEEEKDKRGVLIKKHFEVSEEKVKKEQRRELEVR